MGAYPGLDSTYEGWGSLRAGGDTFAVEHRVAVLISDLFPGNNGFVQTMRVE